MIKLKKVIIEKYKSIESTQEFLIDEKITILVGMNESGKTAILEVLAKSNYFQDDQNFKFDKTYDYPRKEKKQIDKSFEIPIAIKSIYCIDENLLNLLNEDIGQESYNLNDFSFEVNYNNEIFYNNINIYIDKFLNYKFLQLKIDNLDIQQKLLSVQNIDSLEILINENDNDEIKDKLNNLKIYYNSDQKLENSLLEYIKNKYIKPYLPKYLYYDEYYNLPSEVIIEELNNIDINYKEQKTAKALLELSDINVDQIIKDNDYENYKAELEATQSIITQQLFQYWSTNQNLSIEFDIKPEIIPEKINQQRVDRITKHILKIRVKNSRSGVSLPLKNRSKGFNWFFSFLVWFKKIQEDKNSNYILLLDEPGLNLHANAQEDLLRFIEDLSNDYQIIFTTHSPFMIDSSHLDRVRTIFESKEGSIISDSIQEKDPSTLFPLQAALGYDIAQNLFISKNNLLVEGVSDLIYLELFSSLLEKNGRVGLNQGISIVPVGGLDKVVSFISLLRGQKLNIVCLLDSFTDPKSQARLDDLKNGKIIKQQNILFFDEFVSFKPANLEDIFDKVEYIKLFNGEFKEHPDIKIDELDNNIKSIILQLNKHLNIDRFNHYRIARYLASLGVDMNYFIEDTLNRFENIFIKVNQLFNKVK
ncbi:MAG: Uncharacterized protein HW421_3526 [Ignavibacteria bacterium]|nr:Uncharacterized protein [Ignavibacteria bacterium]